MVATIAPIYDEDTSAMGLERALPQVVVEPTSIAPPVATSETSPTVIAMRPMGIDDIDQVRELHEQWFPIRYQQSFYEGAAQGVWLETGFPLFTRLASETPQQAELRDAEQRDAVSAAYGYTAWERRPPMIYGAVMASTIPITSVEDSGLLAPDDYIHTHVMYILTLGSRASVRRRGLASGLLAECIEEARRQPKCGAVYLHVKADNISALRFYEKNGFQNLRYLEDYYMIDGVRHSAYLYILYINGAAPQSGWLEILTKPIMALFSMASHGFKKLLDGLKDEHKQTSGKTPHSRRKPQHRGPPPPFVDDAHINRVSMPSPPSSPHMITVV